MRRAFAVCLFAIACGNSDDHASTLPVGTAAEIAATPRSNEELERLSLMVDRTKLTAEQTTYDRVVRDVTAIRAQDENARNVHYADPTPTELTLSFDFDTIRAVEGGDYHAWDRLNADYRMSVEAQSGGDARLRTRAVYNLELLVPHYQRLSGVTSVNGKAVGSIPENRPPRLCVRSLGEVYRYLFETELIGFTTLAPPRIATWFSVDAAGAITESKRWSAESKMPLDADAESICDKPDY